MTWGKAGRGFSAAEMERLIHHCLDIGIHTFDHADIYGGYTTEADFGEAFAQSGISREDIRLISKCGIQYACEARPNQIKHYQYDTEYIIWSAEQSLQNLQTEYLDLLLLHRPSPLMEPEAVARAFDALRASGKVKQFGVSNFTPSQIRLIQSAVPIEAHQFECSLTGRDALFDGTLDDCIIAGRLAMAWSPLGSYFGAESEQQKRVAECLTSLHSKYEASDDQLLLAWLLKHPAGIHPVVGTTREARLTDAVAALNIELEREDWFALLIAAQGHKVP
jgi:predicted oxidoreductase